MDRDEVRALIREEIALAMKALKEAAEDADGYDTGELESAGLRAIGNAIDGFQSTYRDMCEWTDGERKRLTDPFTGRAPDVASCEHRWPYDRATQTQADTCENCGAGRPHRHEYAWDREAGEMRCVHCERPEPE